MSIVHFLNVKDGDCSVIQHISGRVTVVDVCNATPSESLEEEQRRTTLNAATRGVAGNFQQKRYPVNPISYLKEHSISRVFRYIQTHPDMDHMDGIRAFFTEFDPSNMWDTSNNKEMSDQSWNTSPYRRIDWDFYKALRDNNPRSNPRRLTLLAGARGEYYNDNGGDGLHILAPTQELVDAANESEDYNDCSYVLLYRTQGHRIIFGGDSHDKTWDYILTKGESSLKDIDLLIAPHHGRDSDRSYEFLDVLKPRLTFFGNAPSEHLAYDAWNNRGLSFVTNNQANCMVVRISHLEMTLFVTNETFARKVTPATYFDDALQAWYVCPI